MFPCAAKSRPLVGRNDVRLFVYVALSFMLFLAACQTTSGPSTGDVPAPPTSVAQAPKTNPTNSAAQAQALPTLPPATHTVAPTLTPQPSATRTLSPTLTRTPSPSPTPPAQIRRLTEGECCVAPSWLPDNKRIIFLDKPDPAAATGYYAVDTTNPGAKPELYEPRIVSWTGDFKYIVTRGDGFATIERVEDGQRFRINTGRCSVTQPTGCNVSLSPDRTQVTWSVTLEATGPFEQRTTRIWVANIDGSNARVIAQLLSTRAGASWFPDSKRLLLSGRPSRDSQELVLSVLDLATGQQQEIVRGERISRGGLSPNSKWLIYSVVLHDDEAQNGIWAIRTDGSDRKKLPFFGPSVWRGTSKLLFTPLAETAEYHSFWEYDIETGQTRQLTDPKTTPFKIAFGDWAMSPDGKKIVYVDANERNLWLLMIND